MNIAALMPVHRPSVFYRLIVPMNELVRRGHNVVTGVVDHPSQFPSMTDLARFDVVYLWQFWGRPTSLLVSALNKAGVAVTWDSDDDVSSIPKGVPTYKQAGGMRGQRIWSDMRPVIRAVDAVTTPSEVLAAKYRQVGQENVHVIENALESVAPRPSRKNGQVTIGWFAQMEHGADVGTLRLREVLRRVLEERPHVKVETIGVDLDLGSERYRRHGVVGLMELPELVSRFDIGLAPLADIPFNRARSNVKLKEYGAVGVPWLASPIGPYASLGEEQGGRLVAEDRWYEEILDMVDDDRRRGQLAQAAHRWAQSQTIRQLGGQWEAILGDAVQRVAARRR